MAPLTTLETDSITTQVLQELAETPYACSELVRVSGGTGNFVYRGIPVARDNSSSASQSIIIKHSKDYVPGNKDFGLDASRCRFEQAMLNALEAFPSTSTVTVPHHYYFNNKSNTQIIQDFPEAIDMKTIIVSPSLNALLTLSVATSIGHDIGSWLRGFHTWTSSPAQSGLREEIRQNVSIRALKRQVTYDAFIGILENFPDILGVNRETLQEVREMAVKEFQNFGADDEVGGHGIIHGDFWMGNILACHPESSEKPTTGQASLVIIDWEFAQIGHRSHDLGQMLGDIYERYHFNDIQIALDIFRGFIQGYGKIDEAMAFRMAIHTGVHLLGWYIRRAPETPPTGTQEQIDGAVRIGMEFILRGWRKDRRWFEGSVLSSLFKAS